jgi:uncharacterized small protein (DUF1192 family)
MTFDPIEERDATIAELRAEVERLRGQSQSWYSGWKSASRTASDAMGERDAAESALRQVRELHFAYTIYEPCEHQFTGCGADTCTENPHDGEWFHSDQPVGKACGECNDEEGLFVDYPCPTIDAAGTQKDLLGIARSTT